MTRSLVLTALSVLALACGSQRLSVGADSEREPSGGTAGTSANTFPNSASGGSGANSNTIAAWAGSGATAVDTGINRCPHLDSAGLIDWAAYHAACTPECPCEPFLGVLAGGIGGPGNVDGVGVNARFGFYGDLAGVVRDDAGNLFVSEIQNHTIRRVNIATGRVVTLAGASGLSGSADGVGTSARFSAPAGLALDGAGNLFVADGGNDTIRKVVIATAEVSTIAGTAGDSLSTDGVGASARFESPKGLVADHAGNLFVSDGNKIRKLVIATGAVTTVAGSLGVSYRDGIGSDATFYDPQGLTLDHAGNLFVADKGNYTIRKIELATAAVTTLSVDEGWMTIRESGRLPPSVAAFWAPGAVLADTAGHLYVADSGNARICRVDIATGTLTTLVDSPDQRDSTAGRTLDAEFHWPAGLALDDDAGKLLVVDTQTFTIRKVAVDTGDVTTLAGRAPNNGFLDGLGVAARFSEPGAMAYDGKGHVLVVDERNSEIRRIDLADGSVTTVADMEAEDDCDYDHGYWSEFNGIAVDKDGTAYFADSANLLIKRLDAATGVVTIVGPSCPRSGMEPAERFSTADIVADGAGHLFVANNWNHTIRRVDLATGASTIIAGSSGVAGSADGGSDVARLNSPMGLALDRRGTLFIADTENSTMRSLDLATGVMTTLAGLAGVAGSSDGIGDAARFHHPTDIALDDSGHLFVTDTWNHSVRKIAIQSRSVTTVVGSSSRYGASLGPLPATLSSPAGLAVGPSGELFVSDTNENSVFFVHL